MDRRKEIAENLSIHLINVCQEAKRYTSPDEVFQDLIVVLAAIGQLNGMIDKDFKKGLDSCFEAFSSVRLPDAFFHLVDQLGKEYTHDD